MTTSGVGVTTLHLSPLYPNHPPPGWGRAQKNPGDLASELTTQLPWRLTAAGSRAMPLGGLGVGELLLGSTRAGMIKTG